MNSAQLIEKLNKLEPDTMRVKRHSSVIAPFVEIDGELCLVFETRSGSISQPGEVCFPGGRIDEGESVYEAGLREMKEEIGIGEEFIIYHSDFTKTLTLTRNLVHCTACVLKTGALDHIDLNSGEVADIFTVPLKWFAQNKPEVYINKVTQICTPDMPYEKLGLPENYPWYGSTLDVPVWYYEGHIIWGLTGRFITHILDRLNLTDIEK